MIHQSHYDQPHSVLATLIAQLPVNEPDFASRFVEMMLQCARDTQASDIHLYTTADLLDVRWRLDGVLQPLTQLPRSIAPNVIARLKVLAGLLTYETARPQEGRIRDDQLSVEVRVSTFPSLHGERAVLRLLGLSNTSLESLTQLGMEESLVEMLEARLTDTSGAVLIVGPAGSGKTTTAYACLRQIVSRSQGSRSIASLEDPIEIAVDAVAQSQVNPSLDFTMAAGLRSLLRLDPEVIFVGEIRDRATAEVALQAALTGQLVVTTFHAGNCDDAINRLTEIGIPPYAVRNAVRLVVAQRLVRRLCGCKQLADSDTHARQLGIDAQRCWVPGGCEECRHTGYLGRCLIAEWRAIDGTSQPPSPAIGDRQLWKAATNLIEAGVTSPMEAIRVLGMKRSAKS
jgi:type II secretory ATPase GspE/PulE/Tfp pilus assembly ATPase PilB-like protein